MTDHIPADLDAFSKALREGARAAAIDEAIKIADGKLREINARGTWDDKDRYTNDGAAEAAQEIGNALRALKAL